MKGFFIIALAAAVFSLSSNVKAHELKNISFNCDVATFPKERKILKEKYAELYQEKENFLKVYKEEKRTSSLENSDFCLAKSDLNNDGIDDLLSFSAFGTLTCGSGGCNTNAYLINKDNQWQEVLSIHTYSEGVSIAEIQNGYRILVIKQKISCPCDTIKKSSGEEFINNIDKVVYIYDGSRKRYQAVGRRTD